MEDRLCKLILDSVIERKARDIVVIDISKVSLMADTLVICTGTSKTHTNGIAGYVIEVLKKENVKIFAANGLNDGKWVLVDLGHVIVHVMVPEAREFYTLEKLWSNGEIIYCDEKENLPTSV